MTHPSAISLAAVPIGPALSAALGALLVVLLIGWRIRRGRPRAGSARSGTPAVWVASLAAISCTAYSADTSWRFAADFLDVAGTAERAWMFGAGELALFATALMARQNLNGQGAPGLPGILVWVITGVQIIPAYAESGPVGGTVRAFVGPIMAAMLWHQAMGIELRLHKPDAASQGVLATLGREVRERLLSRLGLAARNRDAAQITHDRATSRAVTLAARLAGRSEKQRANWRGRRIARRLESALARANVGTDPEQRRALLDQLAARRHAAALATVDLPSPWTQPSRDQDEEHRDRSPLAPSPLTREEVGDQAGRWLSVGPHAGPRTGTPLIGDRPDGDHAGPAADTESQGDRPHTVPDNGDRAAAGDRGDEKGASLPGRTGEAGSDGDAGVGNAHETAAQGAKGPSPTLVPNDGDPDHSDTEPGTEPHGDHPHTVPNNGDRGHPDTETGTESHGDRPHTVPLRRKPTPKGARNRPIGEQTKRSRKQPPLTADQLEMVERVRPHVPALLERDGNESLTRVQLREILRAQDLKGGRNDRLTPVLHRLRDEASTTTTRSTAR